MTVTVLLIFGAVAHQGDVILAREVLDQSQRELLAVVLDRPAARVDRAVHEQLSEVLARELRPRLPSREHGSEELLARRERRHPDVVAAGAHPAAAESRRENTQAVAFPV